MATPTIKQHGQFEIDLSYALPDYVFVAGRRVQVPREVKQRAALVMQRNWEARRVQPSLPEGTQICIGLMR